MHGKNGTKNFGCHIYCVNMNLLKIKFVNDHPAIPIIRQIPNNKNIWGNCQFFVNNNIQECDWLIVFAGLIKKEVVKCPKKNTIFITGEPESVKKYNKKFLNQFNIIISCRQDIKHHNIIRMRQLYPWLIGIKMANGKCLHQNGYKNYDYFKNYNTTKKEKLISVISSNRTKYAGHKDRLIFIEQLKKYFGNKIDIYGRGIRNIADKWDAIAPYKYHIVIENSCFKDYWSEKLSDAFLGNAYPIYYGCPNIYDYFSKKFLTTINIKNSQQAIKIIEETIKNNTYDKNKNDIIESKKLVLNQYNIFPTICDIINKNLNNSIKKKKIIMPEQFFVRKISTRIINKINKLIRKL